MPQLSIALNFSPPSIVLSIKGKGLGGNSGTHSGRVGMMISGINISKGYILS